MTTYLAQGSPDTNLNHEQLRNALERVFEKLGPRKSVLAVPPDFTRLDSRAGFITRAVHEHYGDRLKDVLPALGTHAPMSGEQLQEMYAGIPEHLIRVHNWRSDVVRVGNLSAEIVGEITHGAYAQPWPAELNRLVCEGGHDLIFSIGQVVPHEVAGMANHAKNLFIGTGGPGSINQSHFVGAVCGMEKAMGRDDTPVRRLLDLALVRFAEKLPIVFILTVVGRASDGEPSDPSGLVTRGLYVGTGTDCFALAAKLSRELNVQELPQPLDKVVVLMNGREFHSTWLANKSIYRTRMAIADGGELIVLAPGVRRFGEDPEIDRLIRKYGYRTTPEILRFVEREPELAENLAAAAHLIHGSSEGRFRVTYCPGELSRTEVESVGYDFAELDGMLERYRPERLQEGWNQVRSERIFYISRPELGLWTAGPGAG